MPVPGGPIMARLCANPLQAGRVVNRGLRDGGGRHIETLKGFDDRERGGFEPVGGVGGITGSDLGLNEGAQHLLGGPALRLGGQQDFGRCAAHRRELEPAQPPTPRRSPAQRRQRRQHLPLHLEALVGHRTDFRVQRGLDLHTPRGRGDAHRHTAGGGIHPDRGDDAVHCPELRQHGETAALNGVGVRPRAASLRGRPGFIVGGAASSTNQPIAAVAAEHGFTNPCGFLDGISHRVWCDSMRGARFGDGSGRVHSVPTKARLADSGFEVQRS